MELGCRATSSSSPTTTERQSSPMRSMPWTSMPSSVRRSASCSGVRSTSTYSRSQDGDTHQNRSKKRRSFARKARMSRMAYRSIVMRSVPMPKAKPW